MLDTALTRMLQANTARRRQFMTGAAVGAVGLGAGLTASTPARAAAGTGAVSDVDIFNFALNFEYLGAEYYLAALGLSLPAAVGGGTANVLLPSTHVVPFENEAIFYFAQQLADDEYAHVAVIREVLGASAIAEPSIDLDNSWTSLAMAAGLISEGEVFNPFQSETNFLLGAYILEDVCITALCGAAALINSPVNLAYAASILGVEGYQIGMLRQRLSAIGAGPATNAISALRSTLSNQVQNVGVDDNGTDFNMNPFNFTNVDINGQAFRRTPQQVLNIAYGGASASQGGFFPLGVMGAINNTGLSGPIE